MDAQERDIQLFLCNYAETPYEVLGEFVEVHSGNDNERPELLAAIGLAKKENAILVVAKLDRLSRKVSFIATLMEEKGLTFKVAQMPYADAFQLHIYAALAEQERQFISQRTKAALAAAKARGQRFGNPKIVELNKTRKYQAKAFASEVAPIILPLRNRGFTYQQIANTLNEMNLKTVKGCQYQPSQVKRILDRVATGGKN